MIGARLQQSLEQSDYPAPGEHVGGPGPLILGGLPSLQGVQRLAIRRVEYEPEVADVARKPALLGRQLLEGHPDGSAIGGRGRLAVQTFPEGVVPAGQVHDRRGGSQSMIALEGLLSVHEMVELAGGQATRL